MDLTKLNDFMLLEREQCPWASTQTITDMVKEIHSELEELEAELTANPRNGHNLAEEIADVFSDIMLLLHIAERDKQIESKDTIVERALNKKIRRKGWLLEGKKMTRAEASAYWYAAKAEEKKNL